jgi:hypothetical protein
VRWNFRKDHLDPIPLRESLFGLVDLDGRLLSNGEKSSWTFSFREGAEPQAPLGREIGNGRHLYSFEVPASILSS